MEKTSVQSGVRQAKIADAQAIQRLVRLWAEKGKMLHRPLPEIYESIRDFSVYESDGRIVGVIALHVVWETIAEIRSLVVDEEYVSRGVGKLLVENALADAADLGVSELFALTYIPDFFGKFGFSVIDKETLPHKIWSDCVRCHKFPDCDETATSITISPPD